jgi:hypothetical protein
VTRGNPSLAEVSWLATTRRSAVGAFALTATEYASGTFTSMVLILSDVSISPLNRTPGSPVTSTSKEASGVRPLFACVPEVRSEMVFPQEYAGHPLG